MEALTIEAKQRARNAIVKRFKDSVDLENIAAGTIPFYSVLPSFYLLSHSVCAQYNKSLLSADSQLNVTVGGKLDALKRAVDLMDESTMKLDNFTQNMKKTDEKIEAVNTTISNFEYLKRVSHMC